MNLDQILKIIFSKKGIVILLVAVMACLIFATACTASLETTCERLCDETCLHFCNGDDMAYVCGDGDDMLGTCICLLMGLPDPCATCRFIGCTVTNIFEYIPLCTNTICEGCGDCFAEMCDSCGLCSSCSCSCFEICGCGTCSSCVSAGGRKCDVCGERFSEPVYYQGIPACPHCYSFITN